MQANENERQYRIIDQLMTSHAVLRDRYARRAKLLNVSLLSFAIALNGFVFASDDFLKLLFPGHAAAAKIALGIISIALLILSIVELRVDWEGQSRSHSEAVARLSRLKAKYREAHTSKAANRFDELTRDYASTMEALPPIPERSFTRLKAHHEFKRLLSQEISKHPGAPSVLLSIRLRWNAWRKLSSPQNQLRRP
jgi:hypothetical protein